MGRIAKEFSRADIGIDLAKHFPALLSFRIIWIESLFHSFDYLVKYFRLFPYIYLFRFLRKTGPLIFWFPNSFYGE